MVAKLILLLGRWLPVLAVPLLLGTAAPTPERVALVIGNAAYRAQPLPNPRNDAQAMARLLTEAGFAVELRTDVARADLMQSIARFGERLSAPTVRMAVFYYAGHGFQQDWRNFLVPVDAAVRAAADVPNQTVDLSELLRRMRSGPGRSQLIILDACRDDPFAGAWRPVAKGLSQFDAPSGSLVAYATAPGRTAFDGPVGGHGLYTRHLVRELGVADSSVEDALKRVRLNVRLESRGVQVPWELGSLEESLYLFRGRGAQLSEAEIEQRFERELAAFSRVRQTDNVAQLAEFIRNFPSGNTVELAQARLNRLLAEEYRKASLQQQAEASLRPSPAEPAVAQGLPGLSQPPGAGAAIAAPKQEPILLASLDPTPYFAGYHEHERKYRMGDTFVHRVVDRRGSGSRELTLKVTAVDPQADRVEFNGGEYVADMMGNIASNPRGSMSTPRQFYPAELVVGKRWRTVFDQARVSGAKYRFAYDVRVAARERVSVPAGTFDAYRIEATGFNVGLGAYIKRTIWVAPGVAADVAHETYVRLRNGQVEQDDRQELVSYAAR